MAGYHVHYKLKTGEIVDKIVGDNVKVWKHAVNEPDFIYVINKDNADLVADVLKKIYGRVPIELVEVRKVD